MDSSSIISSSMLSDASKKVASTFSTSRAIFTPARNSIVGVAPAKLNSLRATPQASGAAGATDAASSSASDAGEITSNDFLTLLVTEMQNQDPTQPTDPNAYIQQLVGVNSLQQLIAINGDLTTALGTPGTSAATGVGPNGNSVSAIGAATAAPTSMLFGTPDSGTTQRS